MSENAHPDGADASLNSAIGRLLRIGLAVSAILVVIGAVLYLWHEGGNIADYRNFQPEPHTLGNAGEFLEGVMALRGQDVIQLGLLCLIATPVLYVLVALNTFRRQRDWQYVAISSIVLTVLLSSLFFVR